MIDMGDALPPGVHTAADLMQHYAEVRRRMKAQTMRRRGPPVPPPPTAAVVPAVPVAPSVVEPPSFSPRDAALTFARYCVGECNRLAHAAARDVAVSVPGPMPRFNPLFVHGGTGLGKTHLLQALAQDAEERGRSVAYLTAERFMFGFVAAMKAGTVDDFRALLRGADLVLIDDIQGLNGKSVQQAFSSALNALMDAHRQVVIASDRHPGELDSFDERLRSRLGAGLVIEMRPLDEDARGAIIAALVARAGELSPGFDLPDDVKRLLASDERMNGRDLAGAVNRLLAPYQFGGTAVTLEMAQAVLRDVIRTGEPRRVRVDDILRVVTAQFGVSLADILSQRRTANVVRPRQIAMYLAKRMTLRSLPEIGRRFGNRDHTTVLHAVRKMDGLQAADTKLRAELDDLEAKIMERVA